MAIQISQPSSTPEIQYDRVHMVRLDIYQHHQISENTPSVYDIKLKYRYYGVDRDGVRHYKNEGTRQLQINDFIPIAVTAAEAGDPTLLNTFMSVQTGIAAILSRETGIDNIVI